MNLYTKAENEFRKTLGINGFKVITEGEECV